MAPRGPNQRLVRLSDGEARRLAQFYADAEREILAELNRALLKGNKTEYLKTMLQNVQVILDDLRRGSRTWCEEAIPRIYVEGAMSADVQLEQTGAKLVGGFGAIHQQAAQVLAENAYNRFNDVTQFIGRRTDDLYRTLALENVRGSVVGYESWQRVARQYREQLADRGITGFKDAKGRNWNLRSYAEMVSRTTTMEAHLEGTKNRLLEHGYDLVVISSHYNPCDKCKPWEGKVLSLTGQTEGYPTLDEAKAAGLFHPNCRHAYGIHLNLDIESDRSMEVRTDNKTANESADKDADKGYTLKGDIIREVHTYDAGNIKVVVPKDLDTTKQRLKAEDIVSTLQKMPEKLKCAVDEVQILDYRNPDDAYWEKKYNIPGFQSFATGSNRQIHYYENGDLTRKSVLSQLPESMAHEMGHNLDRELGKTTDSGRICTEKTWTEAMEKDYNTLKKQYVSDYAERAGSPVEDFADSVAGYVLNKTGFAKSFPYRAKALRGLGL
jgi:hypothetical protein